ncbi:farnesylcysteine lyase, partial [Quercus suber]
VAAWHGQRERPDFEAGASILHPKNYHAVNTPSCWVSKQEPFFFFHFRFLLSRHLGRPKVRFQDTQFQFQHPFVDKIVSLANSLLMFVRYGFSLLRMQTFVEGTVNNFLKYYERFESRPVFETVDEMLKGQVCTTSPPGLYKRS